MLYRSIWDETVSFISLLSILNPLRELTVDSNKKIKNPLNTHCKNQTYYEVQ